MEKYIKTFGEFVNEAKDWDDFNDKVMYAVENGNKLPTWQTMIEFLKTLSGLDIEVSKGSMRYDKKPEGARIVTSRHETMGTYVTIKDKTNNNKILFDMHSSSKKFSWNLAQVIIKLANPED